MKNNMEKETKDAIEQTKEVLAMERPCRACVFSNESCDWCMENKIPINRYMRGCRKFMTNEEAVRKVAEAEQERQRVVMTKMYFEMDIMGYLANAASLILEKIDKRLDASIEDPGTTSTERENRQKRSLRRKKLLKAYKEIKFKVQDIRSVFENYVEFYFNSIFEEKNGGYDFKESDKNLANSGVIAFINCLMIDKILDNGDNANKILEFLNSLEGANILDENDYGSFLIKK